MKKYLLILLACALTNCTKEKTILVPQEIKEPSWRAHESFFHNHKILSNSFAAGNKLWMIGPYVFTEFDAGRTDPIFYANSELMPLSSKPAISSDFCVYPFPSGDALVIRANAFPVDNGGNIRLAVADLDAPFLAQAIIAASNYQDPVGAFNQSGQLLVAVSDTSGMSVGLIQLQISGSAPFQQLEVASARRIHLRRYDYFCHDIEWCRDRFLVGTTLGAYLVYPTGEFKAIFNRPFHEFFAFHDTVYALSSTELYRSADWGETWQLYSTNFPIWYARFFAVSGRLCFYAGSQMAELEVGSGRIREIDNSGLSTNAITSVSEFNAKVYVTTLSGLFYQNVKDFFTYKEETTNQRLNTTVMVMH